MGIEERGHEVRGPMGSIEAPGDRLMQPAVVDPDKVPEISMIKDDRDAEDAIYRLELLKCVAAGRGELEAEALAELRRWLRSGKSLNDIFGLLNAIRSLTSALDAKETIEKLRAFDAEKSRALGK